MTPPLADKPSNPAAGRSRLEGMDALRGIAALLVVMLHLAHMQGRRDIFQHGWLAVDLFFVLSGYVMARTYEPRLAAGMGLRGFMGVRLHRLWPTMACGAAIGLVVLWPTMPVAASLIGFTMALALLPWPGPPGTPLFPTNPPAWSILYELFANALHAAVLRRLGNGALAGIMALSAALLLTLSDSMDVGGEFPTLGLGAARVLYSYCAGMLIWRVVGERALLPGWLGLLLLPLGVLASGALPQAYWIEPGFIFLACPLAVVSAIAPLPFGGRLLGWLGAMSFPLYAVHYPVLLAVKSAGLPDAAALLAAFAAAWLVSRLVAAGWPVFRRMAAA